MKSDWLTDLSLTIVSLNVSYSFMHLIYNIISKINHTLTVHFTVRFALLCCEYGRFKECIMLLFTCMRLKGKNKPNIAFLNHMIDDALAELPLFFGKGLHFKDVTPFEQVSSRNCISCVCINGLSLNFHNSVDRFTTKPPPASLKTCLGDPFSTTAPQ